MSEEKKSAEQIVLDNVRQKLSHKGQEYAVYCSRATPTTRVILLFVMIAILIALGYVFVEMKDSVEVNNMNNYYLGRIHCDCGKVITSEQKYCIDCGAHTGQAKVEPYKECLQCEKLYNPDFTYCKLCGEKLVQLFEGKMITLEELGIKSFLGVSNIYASKHMSIFTCAIFMCAWCVGIILVIRSILYGYKLYTIARFVSDTSSYIDNTLYELRSKELAE